MQATFAAIVLAFGMASAASAQLAPLESGGAPAPLDGLAVGVPADAGLRDAPPETAESTQRCREQSRSFRARNSQSPSRREQALETCLAAARRNERVDVAGP